MSDLKKLQQSEAQKRVNLADWRRSRRHELDLPSGLHVIVRDVDMTDILVTGMLPAPILELAKEADKTTGEMDLEKIGLEMMEKNASDFITLLDSITKAALVVPAIVDQVTDPDDNEHMMVNELPVTDKFAIMEFVNRGAEQIKPFRQEPDQPMADPQPGGSVPLQAE